MQFARKNFLIFWICGKVREIMNVSAIFIMQILQSTSSCQTLSGTTNCFFEELSHYHLENSYLCTAVSSLL